MEQRNYGGNDFHRDILLDGEYKGYIEAGKTRPEVVVLKSYRLDRLFLSDNE